MTKRYSDEAFAAAMKAAEKGVGSLHEALNAAYAVDFRGIRCDVCDTRLPRASVNAFCPINGCRHMRSDGASL